MTSSVHTLQHAPTRLCTTTQPQQLVVTLKASPVNKIDYPPFFGLNDKTQMKDESTKTQYQYYETNIEAYEESCQQRPPKSGQPQPHKSNHNTQFVLCTIHLTCKQIKLLLTPNRQIPSGLQIEPRKPWKNGQLINYQRTICEQTHHIDWKKQQQNFSSNGANPSGPPSTSNKTNATLDLH